MITPEKAFEIAQAYSLDKLECIAYDAGKYWLFDYAPQNTSKNDEDDEVVDGACPILVNKNKGTVEEMYLWDSKYKELWKNFDSFPPVKLKV